MATRFYLPDTGVAAVSPAFDGSWERTAAADRRRCVTAKIGSTIANRGNVGFGVNPSDTLIRQYVSDPLSAASAALLASTPGNVKGQARCQENAATDDVCAQLLIAVCSNDGATIRGTLLPHNTAVLSSEWANASSTNRNFPRGGSTALTAVASAVANDRIVIEMGYRQHSTVTINQTIRFGDSAASDLPEDETTTTDLNPWIEFSADVSPPSLTDFVSSFAALYPYLRKEGHLA